MNKEIKTDPIVGSVITKYLERSSVGIQKYGTTLEENNKDNFLKHFQEELMDASLYVEKLMNQKTFENIKPEIVDWFKKKGLIHKENSAKQLCKVLEELGELSSAILKQNEAEERDAFGDVLITLIGLAEMREINLIECLYEAYEVIKNRKGKVQNGTFIREK